MRLCINKRRLNLKNKVLDILFQNKGKTVTGGDIAAILGVSRNTVWKSVNALKADGFDITSFPNSGYCLSQDDDSLSEAEIRRFLTAKAFGSEIEIAAEIDSTNAELKRRTEPMADGFVLVANRQTGGKGRLGRAFSSEKGQGIYMSIALKPLLPIEQTQHITICAAVAVCNAIEAVCGFSPQVKWVNDIYYQGKKLCGILTEAVIGAELGKISLLVLGIGLNTGKIPSEFADIAGSIADFCTEKGLRNRLIAQILNNLEAEYSKLGSKKGFAEIIESYRKRQFIFGEKVIVNNFTSTYEATALDIDGEGRLLINADGKLQKLGAGEVSLKVLPCKDQKIP